MKNRKDADGVAGLKRLSFWEVQVQRTQRRGWGSGGDGWVIEWSHSGLAVRHQAAMYEDWYTSARLALLDHQTDWYYTPAKDEDKVSVIILNTGGLSQAGNHPAAPWLWEHFADCHENLSGRARQQWRPSPPSAARSPPPPAPRRRSQPKIELRRSGSGLHSFRRYHVCLCGHCKSSSPLSTSHLLSLKWHYSCRYHYLDSVRITAGDLFICCTTSRTPRLLPWTALLRFLCGTLIICAAPASDGEGVCLASEQSRSHFASDSQVVPRSPDSCLSLFTCLCLSCFSFSQLCRWPFADCRNMLGVKLLNMFLFLIKQRKRRQTRQGPLRDETRVVSLFKYRTYVMCYVFTWYVEISKSLFSVKLLRFTTCL